MSCTHMHTYRHTAHHNRTERNRTKSVTHVPLLVIGLVPHPEVGEKQQPHHISCKGRGRDGGRGRGRGGGGDGEVEG